MRKIEAFTLAVVFVWLLGCQLVWAQNYDDKEQAVLAQALKRATNGHAVAEVTLLKGNHWKTVSA